MKRNPRSIKNINRFDYDTTDFQGWRVNKMFQGVTFSKYFPDSQSGPRSKDKSITSLKKAKKALKELLKERESRTFISFQLWAKRQGYCVSK